MGDKTPTMNEVVSEVEEVGAVGLDVGTSRIVVAGGHNGHKGQTQLNSFVAVPYSRMTEAILQQNKMVYHRNGKDLYVFGNDSERFASFFSAEPRRPMQRGVINPQEPMGSRSFRRSSNRWSRAAAIMSCSASACPARAKAPTPTSSTT